LGRRGAKVRWGTVGRIMIGWLLTLPAAGAVGAAAALLVVWLGGWGITIGFILGTAVVLGLFIRSRSQVVDHSNAMSDVADSGHAFKVKKKLPPTPRQARIKEE